MNKIFPKFKIWDKVVQQVYTNRYINWDENCVDIIVDASYWVDYGEYWEVNPIYLIEGKMLDWWIEYYWRVREGELKSVEEIRYIRKGKISFDLGIARTWYCLCCSKTKI